MLQAWITCRVELENALSCLEELYSDPERLTRFGDGLQLLSVPNEHEVAVVGRAADPCPLLRLAVPDPKNETAVSITALHLPFSDLKEGVQVFALFAEGKVQECPPLQLDMGNRRGWMSSTGA